MPARTTFVFCPACPLAETCSPGAWKRAGVWGWDEQEAREKLRHHLVMSGLHQCSEEDADYLIESVIWEVDEYTAPDPPAPKKARQVLQEVRQPDKQAQAPAPVQDVIAETIRQMTQQQAELDGGAPGSGSSAGFRPRLDSVWPIERQGDCHRHRHRRRYDTIFVTVIVNIIIIIVVIVVIPSRQRSASGGAAPCPELRPDPGEAGHGVHRRPHPGDSCCQGVGEVVPENAKGHQMKPLEKATRKRQQEKRTTKPIAITCNITDYIN